MRTSFVGAFLLAAQFFLAGGLNAQDPPPVVHAVLFYSPTCPHCHQVITETLIPMQNRYGSRLVVLAFDVTQRYGHDLYMGMLRNFKIPEANWVVPILVVGEEVMIGGVEIPERLPRLVDEGLASGGIDLPNLSDLLQFLESQDLLETRYPGRRMARQPPAAPEEQPPGTPDSAAVEARAGGDTVGVPVDTTTPTRDTSAAARDTAAVVRDTAAAAPPARPAEAGVPPRDTTAPTRLPTVPRDTSAAAAAGATGDVGEPAAPEAAPRVRDSAAGPGVSDSVTTPAPQEAQGAAPQQVPSPGEIESPLDLARAARDIESANMWDRFRRDPGGNSLAVAVLLFIVVSLVWTGYPPRARGRQWPGWVVPVLVVVGAGVAAYLSFVEVTRTEAVCGPVGDCNTVNQSEYARVFGVLPVGVLGLVGYAVILLLWLVARKPEEGAQVPATLGLWGAALFGTLFSLYLTFLEPFVIGATCAWCLASAVIMTLLLWASAPLAGEVWGGVTPEGSGEAFEGEPTAKAEAHLGESEARRKGGKARKGGKGSRGGKGRKR